MDSTAFLVIAFLAIGILSFLLFLAFFGPVHKYKVRPASALDLHSPDFLRLLEALCDSRARHKTRVDVLTNGEVFYEAQLEAIRHARSSINLEAYIFQKGEVTRRFVSAMAERARAGVHVNIVLDALGCFTTWNSYLGEVTAAGGRLEWYHPLRWDTWPRINNRTHREILVVDGEIGFIGGAGYADHWYKGRKRNPKWRDTVWRVTGNAVTGLQSTFCENWLEASGEILTGKEYFPFPEVDSVTAAIVVNSTPSAGYSTHGRMLFQTLMASATESIQIATPYFLPDRSARAELIRAVKERGVDVRIVVPGKYHDHPLARRTSRRLFGDLLEAGVKIYEYGPSMFHVKCMIVDGRWSVVGSTNFDNRSFGLNDELNLAAADEELAARLNEDFRKDLAVSEQVTYDAWCRRSLFERCHEWLGWILERQQ
jgi:cardiolipin synthase